METKIRMYIDSEFIKIHLPKISFTSAIQFMKFGLKGPSYANDQEMKEYIHSNKENFNQFVETTPMEMNMKDPLNLVDELNILHLLMH
jgi:hypothetical protein